MTARLTGRVVEVSCDQGLGCPKNLRIDSANGMVCIFKPDVWHHDSAYLYALVGKEVTVTVDVQVIA